MKTIVLIGCGKRKLEHPTLAKDMYQGPLFKKSWQLAEMNYPKSERYILSAKHYLLDPDETIEPYDKTLNGMNVSKKREWAEKVIQQLREKNFDLENDLFIFYAGKAYTDYLVTPKGPIKNYKREFEGGTGIGAILHNLSNQLEQLILNFQGSYEESVVKMRRNLNVDDSPGVYRLWVPQELVDEKLKDLDCDETLSKTIEGKDYRALYVGMSKNLYDRLNWHINDKHYAETVKSGFISTLRHTIGAFLGDENKPLTKLEADVNEFLDKCYFEWEYTASEGMATYIESELIAENYYPFNIQHNPNLPKAVRNDIIKRRKAVKG